MVTNNRTAPVEFLSHFRYAYVREPLILTGFFLTIGLLKIGYHMKRKFSEWVPESCCLIFVGILLGKLFSLDPNNESLDFLVFHSRTFFLFILPPIILEASYSLRDAAFVGNISTTLLYASLGTLLNIILVGISLWGCAVSGLYAGVPIRWVDCFVFSALIASVDPVAVLAIFQQVGVNKVLYFLVLGESIFNDAVTIVTYDTMILFSKTGGAISTDTRDISPETCMVFVGNHIFLAILSFFVSSCGGTIIGFVCGIITAILTKYTRNVKAVEPVFLLGMAYMSYLVAEMFSFSGIISIIVCGINQVYYAMENISEKSSTTVIYFSKAASSAMEALVFIILGVTMMNDRDFWVAWNTNFALTALAFVILYRFIVMYALTLFANFCMAGLRHITFSEQLIMSYGGLRGAVSFSLVIMLSPKDSPAKNMLLTATYLIILFTVFVQGITIKPLVGLLSVKLRHKRTVMIAVVTNTVIYDIMWGVEQIVDYERFGRISTLMAQYMNKYLLRPHRYVPSKVEHSNRLLQSLHNLKREEEEDYSPYASQPALERVVSDYGTFVVIPSTEPDIHAALSNPAYRYLLSNIYDRDLTGEQSMEDLTTETVEQDHRLLRVFSGRLPPWTPRNPQAGLGGRGMRRSSTTVPVPQQRLPPRPPSIASSLDDTSPTFTFLHSASLDEARK